MIRHLLLDADGVVQRAGNGGWRATLLAQLGDRTDDFVARLRELEQPSLVGRGSFPDGIEEVLADLDVDVDPEELYTRAWLSIETVPETVALVRSLRRPGLGVHLVTNQHDRRAAYMKQTLGYDEALDSCFYSCDLGVAKPDPAFFALVGERLGAAPDDLLLIDDTDANVVAARAAGLAAERWHHDDGRAELDRRLAIHGVRPEPEPAA